MGPIHTCVAEDGRSLLAALSLVFINFVAPISSIQWSAGAVGPSVYGQSQGPLALRTTLSRPMG